MSEDASNNLFESSDEESETKVAPDVKPDVADNVKVEVVEEPIVLKKEEPVDVTQASNAALFESDEEEGSGDEVARRSGASSTSAAMSDAVPSGQASSTSTKEEDDADRDLFVVVAQGEPVTAEIPPPKMYPSNDIVSTFSLPNAVAIEPNEFNPKNFDESKSSFSKSRINITRTTGSVIRWRKVKDENGNEKVESNTRIIRWPDGTVQLQLGDEVFTVSSRQVQPTEYELVYRDGAETVNTCMGVITSRLKFMPSDLAKSATHRSLRQDVAKRSAREQIVRSKQFVDFTQRQAELAKLKESVRMPAKGGAAGGIGGKKSSKRFLEISGMLLLFMSIIFRMFCLSFYFLDSCVCTAAIVVGMV